MVDMRDRDDVFYNWPFDDGYGSDDEQCVSACKLAVSAIRG